MNDETAAMVQDAGAYQRLLDIAARADANEGIRQGLEEARPGARSSGAARNWYRGLREAIRSLRTSPVATRHISTA